MDEIDTVVKVVVGRLAEIITYTLAYFFERHEIRQVHFSLQPLQQLLRRLKMTTTQSAHMNTSD